MRGRVCMSKGRLLRWTKNSRISKSKTLKVSKSINTLFNDNKLAIKPFNRCTRGE